MPKSKERQPLKAGMTFTKVFRNKKYTMRAVKIDKKIKFRVEDNIFKSPSGAAKYITKNSVNGWIFWGIDQKPAYHKMKKK
jgi:hypothetical protein